MQNIFKKKSVQWWVGCTSCTALFIFILTFAYFKMDLLIQGVDLHVTINKGADSVVQIRGSAVGATYLTLNGREIYVDRDGSFNESLVLLPGLSVVKLDTEDKFGNTREEKFEIVYSEKDQSFAINNQGSGVSSIINKN